MKDSGSHTLSKEELELFDRQWYLQQYPDVQMLGMDPVEHYLWLGKELGRSISPDSTASKAKKQINQSSGYKQLENIESLIQSNRTEKKTVDKNIVRGEIEKTFGNLPSDNVVSLLFGSKEKGGHKLQEQIQSHIHPSTGKKVVVYTAVFGNYDVVREPAYIDENVDYLCFTDQEDFRSDAFKVIRVDKLFENNTQCARMLKTLPHIFLPGYETSVWIDGSARIRGLPLQKLIKESLSNNDIAVHSHFQRDCVYQEAKECIHQRKDDNHSIERQIEYIAALGYPENNGLVETAQVIRRHSEAVSLVNEYWWSFIRDFSIRDQLSFNVVCWFRNIEYYRLEGCQWLDQYFKNYAHKASQVEGLNPTDPVTLVMLVRNALEMTRKSVASVLTNTSYAAFKLIIVDNDSDTDTKAYLNNLQETEFNVEVITNKENLSFSKANNDAVLKCTDEYLLFINNDIEIIDADWLAVLVSEMKSNQELGAVGPVLLYPDYKIQSAGIKIEVDDDTVKVPAKEQKVYRHASLVDGITGGCMLVRRSVHEAIGGFDERFFYGQEDIDYCLKIKELGYKIKLLTSCEAIHHESYTRKFTSWTLRNREVLRLKWKGRIVDVLSGQSASAKLKYADLLQSRGLRYKSLEDLNADIKSNFSLVPEQVDLVVGIPRSGMIPAYIIGLALNQPVISFDEFLSDIEPLKGDRPQNLIAEHKSSINALFVDDSINNGNAFGRISQMPKNTYMGKLVERQYLAVYGSENWHSDEVLTLEHCQTPRLFQWNYTNHGIAQFSCYDLDGVLCIDPTDEQNDDGGLYRDFVLNARPLYIPKYKIRAIVTSRLEKYRDITEQWLKKHGVQYEKLYMLDLPSKEERIRLNIHGKFKAELYSQMQDAHLFVESNIGQAKEIAKLTGKAVVCTGNDCFYPAINSSF